MDRISQSGLAMRLEERADELNNLAIQTRADINNAKLVETIMDIIDNRRYSYLYALLKGHPVFSKKEAE